MFILPTELHQTKWLLVKWLQCQCVTYYKNKVHYSTPNTFTKIRARKGHSFPNVLNLFINKLFLQNLLSKCPLTCLVPLDSACDINNIDTHALWYEQPITENILVVSNTNTATTHLPLTASITYEPM